MTKLMLDMAQNNNIDIYKIFESLPVEIKEHGKRVSRIANLILKKVFENKVYDVDILLQEALLTNQNIFIYHDIGKSLIPDRILNKTTALTFGEERVMNKHAKYGGEILERYLYQMKSNIRNEVALILGIEVATSHHERWDGNGYPYGQLATATPISARACAIADTYDNITNELELPCEYALLEISDCSGTQFDPLLVDVFREFAFKNIQM